MTSKTEISLFNKYSLAISKKLKWHQSGLPGQYKLSITDAEETFIVSFVEGMKLMDMLPNGDSVPAVSYQSFRDGKYIHQKRNTAGNTAFSYFHIELEDEDGKQHCLAGQIVVDKGYQWTDGVEPLLMELLEGIDVCKTKGGGDGNMNHEEFSNVMKNAARLPFVRQ
jgi:hypothetical protein